MANSPNRRINRDIGYTIVTSFKHGDVLFEYTDGLADYIGIHTSHDPGTDDENWTIWKCTWDCRQPDS